MRTISILTITLSFLFTTLYSQNNNHEVEHDHSHADHDHEVIESSNHYKRAFDLDVKNIKRQLASKSAHIILPYMAAEAPFEVKEFKYYDGDVNPLPGLQRLPSPQCAHSGEEGNRSQPLVSS